MYQLNMREEKQSKNKKNEKTMEILNNEAENENTLFSPAILRRVSNEDLIRVFVEGRKELKFRQENSWNNL